MVRYNSFASLRLNERRTLFQPVNRLNDLLQAEPGWETALSKGISFSDLDETQGNRTRNSLYDSFEDLKVNRREKKTHWKTGSFRFLLNKSIEQKSKRFCFCRKTMFELFSAISIHRWRRGFSARFVVSPFWKRTKVESRLDVKVENEILPIFRRFVRIFSGLDFNGSSSVFTKLIGGKKIKRRAKSMKFFSLWTELCRRALLNFLITEIVGRSPI